MRRRTMWGVEWMTGPVPSSRGREAAAGGWHALRGRMGDEVARNVPQAPPGGYAAFISYRHKPLDRRWAMWLHGALETFRTPPDLVEMGFPPRLGRVFRDEEEVPSAADLPAEIEA